MSDTAVGRFDRADTLAAAALALGVGAAIAVQPFNAPPWLLAAGVIGALAIPVAVTRPDFFVYSGLILLSFDRFLAIEVGSLTVKPSHVLFGYALAGAVAVRLRRKQRQMLEDVPWTLILVTVVLATLYVVATALSPRPAVGARKLLVIAGGSVVPALAILATITSAQKVLTAVRFFVLGQFLVALYAVYEFAATYFGLPTAVPYYGAVGSVSRVTAFSFEPGYYAAYIITGVPLILSDIRRHQHRLGATVSPVLIGTVVLLALLITNSRAGFVALTVTLLGLWVLKRKPEAAGLRVRGKRSIVVPLVAAVLLTGLAASAAGFNLIEFARDRLASITDPAEPTSNAPRLTLYRAVVEIIRDHPATGVGPGMIGYVLPEYGVPVAPLQAHFATANSIWLEGAAEVGLGAIPLIALVMLLTLYLVLRRSPVDALALGALVFLLVHGAFVSFLWDMKFWVVVALALVTHRGLPPGLPSDGHRAAVDGFRSRGSSPLGTWPRNSA